MCVKQKCYTGTHTIHQGNWYHVGIIFKAVGSEDDQVAFYFNGLRDEATFYPHETLQSEDYKSNDSPIFFLGADLFQKVFYAGVLDAISIWSYAFSDKQMINSVYSQFGGFEKGLVAFWDADQSERDRLIDRSSHKLNLSLKGSPTFFDGLTRPFTTTNPCL